MLVVKQSPFIPYGALAFTLTFLLMVNVLSIVADRGLVDIVIWNIFIGIFVYVSLRIVRHRVEPVELEADSNGVSYYTSAKISLFTFKLLERPRKMFVPWGEVGRIWHDYYPQSDSKALFLELEKSQFDGLDAPAGGMKSQYEGTVFVKKDTEYRLVFSFGSKSKLISELLYELKNGVDVPGDREIVVW